MGDKDESRGAEQPPLDPGKLLRQLEALIKDNSKAIDKSGGRVGASAIWSILIPILVLIGIAAFTWYSRKNGRELAKLRHEKNKAKILADQAEIGVAIQRYMSAIEAFKKKAAKQQDELRIIEADIRAEEARHEADRRAIDRMRSWDGSYHREG